MNTMTRTSVLFICSLIHVAVGGRIKRESPNKPLILTPYIEQGKYDKARQKAEVKLDDLPDLLSYSGFVTVDKEKNNNIFFWMVPQETEPENKPLLLWIQGGPGSSSIKLGKLRTHGPFSVNEDLSLSEREFRWNKLYNMVYIDAPIGAGYSFTDAGDDGFSKTLEETGEELYNALVQIMKIFPEYSQNGFYITGANLAALGHYIINLPESEIKFEGLIVWAGWCDSAWMFRTYSDLIYNNGHFDEDQRDIMQGQLDIALDHMDNGDLFAAFEAFDKVLYVFRAFTEGIPNTYVTFTGMNNIFNSIEDGPANQTLPSLFLAQKEVAKAIHVGDLLQNNQLNVIRNLRPVIVQNVSPWLAEIVDAGYKVLFVAGNVDVISTSTGSGISQMINNFPWSKTDAYSAAERKPWRLEPDSVGVDCYIKSVDDFHFVMMRNGGHYTPEDAPAASLEIMRRFIENEPFF